MKAVEVWWEDHAFHNGTHHAAECGLSQQHTIGWLAEETEDYLKVAQTWIPDDKLWSEVLVIDKRAVTRKRVVRST